MSFKVSKKFITRLKKERIAVLCGGTSSESDISRESGRAVFEGLRASGIQPHLIDIKDNFVKRLLKFNIDIVFNALHGRPGEDGTVQGLLEILNIPYTGSGVLASGLAIDKIYTKAVFSSCDLPIPKYVILERTNRTSGLNKIRFPVIVKPADQGSTIGVRIVKDRRALEKAFKLAFRYSKRIIVEEYIEGREITVGILGEKPLPVIEIVPKRRFYDFQAKYVPGMSEHVIPAKIEKVKYRIAQELGVKAHHALGCRGATRVDMMMDEKGKIFILEVNTIPGMTRTSLLPEAASRVGIDFPHLIAKILELAVINR